MNDKNNLTAEHRVSPEELEIYRKLKPFISHCLTLNHDINNPLAGIIGYTDFMLDNEESLTKDQEKYLRQIAKCAERIRVLVTELSDEKIALSEGIDMHAVIENFNASAKPLH
jgi:signal transduction histidine kinase